jgi:hypothetical protein
MAERAVITEASVGTETSRSQLRIELADRPTSWPSWAWLSPNLVRR